MKNNSKFHKKMPTRLFFENQIHFNQLDPNKRRRNKLKVVSINKNKSTASQSILIFRAGTDRGFSRGGGFLGRPN